MENTFNCFNIVIYHLLGNSRKNLLIKAKNHKYFHVLVFNRNINTRSKIFSLLDNKGVEPFTLLYVSEILYP